MKRSNLAFTDEIATHLLGARNDSNDNDDGLVIPRYKDRAARYKDIKDTDKYIEFDVVAMTKK